MGIELSPQSWKVLAAFGCYLVGVMGLGLFAHRYLTRGSFLREYFLGNRGLGPWVLALTVAATAISGGTFMGFPSLIYSNGWIMSLWIASYMIVPLTGMALIGKRINQVSRMTGAVTVPDVLRDRFQSPALGIFAGLFILLFLVFNLVAQFKAGGLVMKEALGLRPADATFLEAKQVGDDVLLSFRLPDGSEPKPQVIPLPKNARLVEARADTQERNVFVDYRPEGQDKKETKRVVYPGEVAKLPGFSQPIDKGYLLGLLVFALTVVAYTTYGGFWAVTWTDVFEGLVMLAGVVLMAVLALKAVKPVEVYPESAAATSERKPIEVTGLAAATERLRQQDPALVYGPGPKNYLPLGMAFSFFLMWSIAGPGQPSGMVRLMSFKDSASLRRALLLLCGYYVLTYLSLLIIFICARAIFPTEYLRDIGTEGKPDSIMPAMARRVTEGMTGGDFLSGFLLAAPYAAIMSTVAAFLLMISSSLVRDLYQRTINPNVSQRTIKVASYLITGLVGVGVMIAALNPPSFLQYIIVFTGSGQSCSFLIPMVMGLYWRRATRLGTLAAMLGGFLAVIGLYGLGWADSWSATALREHTAQMAKLSEAERTPLPEDATRLRESLHWLPGWGEEKFDSFAPLYVFGMDPLVWGMLVSAALGVGVSLLTRPDPVLTAKFFPSESA